MCTSPVSIPNPNFHRMDRFSSIYDTQSAFISVPCGVCDECRVSKQLQLVQRVLMESTENHIFFSTMTYNNAMLPVHVCSNGRTVRYAKYEDLNGVIRRLRRDSLFPRPFRYFCVSELGSRRARPHFHGLWLVPKYDGDDYNTCLSLEKSMFDTLLRCWCRNVGSRKYPLYVPLCTYVRRMTRNGVKTNFDLHYVNPSYSEDGVADVGFYVLKYMLKPSDHATRLQRALHLNLSEEEYNRVWKIVRPRYFKSHDFGLSKSDSVRLHLRRGLDLFKDDYPYPVFLNPVTGTTMPLSRFYRSSGVYTFDDALYLKEHYPDSFRQLSFTDYRKSDIRGRFLSDVAQTDKFDDIFPV